MYVKYVSYITYTLVFLSQENSLPSTPGPTEPVLDSLGAAWPAGPPHHAVWDLLGPSYLPGAAVVASSRAAAAVRYEHAFTAAAAWAAQDALAPPYAPAAAWAPLAWRLGGPADAGGGYLAGAAGAVGPGGFRTGRELGMGMDPATGLVWAGVGDGSAPGLHLPPVGATRAAARRLVVVGWSGCGVWGRWGAAVRARKKRDYIYIYIYYMYVCV
jgi:hypothetical protein